ncbi:hypothetical protein OROHE_014890 [Orobanche hederae]
MKLHHLTSKTSNRLHLLRHKIRMLDKIKDENDEEKDEENEQDQQPQIPEEFIFYAEGGLVDEKLLFFAQQAHRRKGKAGSAKNVIFSEE